VRLRRPLVAIFKTIKGAFWRRVSPRIWALVCCGHGVASVAGSYRWSAWRPSRLSGCRCARRRQCSPLVL